MRKGQLWSTDVLIGVTIFVGVIALFYASLTLTSKSDFPMLKNDAKMATIRLFEPDSAITVMDADNELNMTRLSELAAMDYDTLRDRLGIRGEYCIYLEDRFGRLVPVRNQSGIGKDLNISDTICGDTIPGG